VGTEHEIPLGSFSYSQHEAEKFAQWETDAATSDNSPAPVEVTFTVASGAQHYDIPYDDIAAGQYDATNLFPNEEEVLVSGGFKVTGVERYDSPDYYEVEDDAENPTPHPALMVTLEPTR
jgi:outer membrane receptor for ferric coprogen and ferric-rhodotorulic acid